MGLSMILSLLCGVALFLFGMSLMGDGLQKVAGNRLELTLYRLSKSPVKGMLLGAGVTAVIQSASATSVMVIGFVNSGIMKVVQSIGVIIGANIGTSINGWILCLSYMEESEGVAQLLSTATVTAVVAIVGIIIKMFSKRSFFRNVSDVMFGFVILMVGMQMMSSAVAPLGESKAFQTGITMFSHPLLGILLGIIVSGLLQSSCAAIGVLQALSATGGINFASAFPIIMGIGVGASCPVLLSGIGMSKNGKRTALSFLVVNVFGVLGCAILFYATNAFFHLSVMEKTMSPVGIAFVNSAFRIALAILLLPLIRQIDRLLFWLIPNKEEDEFGTEDFELLDERFLETPAFAIGQSHAVMDGMIKKVENNLISALNLLDDFTDQDYRKVAKREKLINKYEDKLEAYLVQLPAKEMEKEQNRQVSKILYMVGEFERLADQAVNIADVASDLYERKTAFSEDARKELSVLNGAVREILSLTIEAFRRDDVEMAQEVSLFKETVSALCSEYKMSHIGRIQTGKCNKQSEFLFHELLDEMEHIAVYCVNVTVTMIELETQSDGE